MKVLLTDYAWTGLDVERTGLAGIGAELVVSPSPDEATLAGLAADADAILTCWAQVSERVLDAGPRLRIVARLGIGLDNIDVAACTRRKILVTNVPDYCQAEVAEHTLALLFALARRVAWFHHETQSGRYDLRAGGPLRRISGQTLGLVGFGSIGRAVAQRAGGMGLRVLATRRQAATGVCQTPGLEHVQFASLDDALAQSDYVSLHVPLTPETRRLIGAAQLARMKPTASLINTARGGLIDPAALAAALAAGRLAGAAVDVQDPEPPNLNEPPWNDPRVIVTPHAAFSSVESIADLRVRAVQQVVDCLTGKRPENIVNRTALE